ncbi:hypothetical protein [Dyadobacter pollutisoli]|uniref:Uncharacterized protein n=1 Tax=Dyadobacter pollutisoli TaxID=2910158 RepID=A0A9E8NGJ0_9BACT|nr:hypothetical protein [Dyadobacter pollutisoli]WAC14587.1 hypothetical protein ON006_11625 [Dyadobacter pollutisoli]
MPRPRETMAGTNDEYVHEDEGDDYGDGSYFGEKYQCWSLGKIAEYISQDENHTGYEK